MPLSDVNLLDWIIAHPNTFEDIVSELWHASADGAYTKEQVRNAVGQHINYIGVLNRETPFSAAGGKSDAAE